MNIKYIGAGSIVVFGVIAFLIFLIISNNDLNNALEDEVPRNTVIGDAEGTIEGSDTPIKLISVCVGEGTKTVECTFIPFDESLRTPEENALAERAERE